MSELPRPVTNDQEYLAAILDELRGISAKLDVLQAQTAPVELEHCIPITEPASASFGGRAQAVSEPEPEPAPKPRRSRRKN
jgi:hypothetical protein